MRKGKTDKGSKRHYLQDSFYGISDVFSSNLTSYVCYMYKYKITYTYIYTYQSIYIIIFLDYQYV